MAVPAQPPPKTQSAESDDLTPMEGLVPSAYDALRRLARRKLLAERPGQTLQATALVHEAYLRLYHNGCFQWSSPAHFYGAAAEAMRRILIERARRYRRLKHGNGLGRVALDDVDVRVADEFPDILALEDALTRLEKLNPRKAALVKLRYFVGLTIAEAAVVLEISPATAKLDWAFARAWLEKAIREHDAG